MSRFSLVAQPAFREPVSRFNAPAADPIHATPLPRYVAEDAARNLAVRYHAFTEASRRVRHDSGSDAYAALACWSDMLAESVEITGIDLHPAPYLRLKAEWARAMRNGETCRARLLMDRMFDQNRS